MNRSAVHQVLSGGAAALLIALAPAARAAPAFAFSSLPLFLETSVNPNVLVLFDNSQSMDATMAGRGLQGDDPASRTSIARAVLRNVITTYRYNFNWGLATFELANDATPAPYAIFGYYLGNDATMVYTNTCNTIVDGIGVSDRTTVDPTTGATVNLRCIGNPDYQTDAAGNRTYINGYPFVTFMYSGDDANVNEVAYLESTTTQQAAAVASSFLYGYGRDLLGTGMYRYYRLRAAGTTDWSDQTHFSGCYNRGALCPPGSPQETDTEFDYGTADVPNMLLVKRGIGFNNDISGYGKINEPIVASQTLNVLTQAAEVTHYNNLMRLLAQLTSPTDFLSSSPTVPIKDAASSTPLAGSLESSRNYFANGLGNYPSPVTLSCQRNYMVLATDGNPTGKKDGTSYPLADRANTRQADGTWAFGAAANDVFAEIDLLRNLTIGSNANGVLTYVVGMGDTTANASSVAALNEMARRGGTGSAYVATSAAALTDSFRSIVSRIEERPASSSSVTFNSSSYQSGTALYQGKFYSQSWTGDLLAYPIDSGGALASAPAWQAARQIAAQNPATDRRIFTYKPLTGAGAPGVGIPFRWPTDPNAADALGSTQIAALNLGPTGTADGYGELRLAYLRGDTSREVRNCANCTPAFHNRVTADPGSGSFGNVLGDIVNSAPFYVGPPASGYDDGIEAPAYSAFAALHASRAPTLYVGANDGMLHAIDATTGNERFAYVPNLVFSSLSRQTAQAYAHQYTVDGSPFVGDMFHDGAWHSLLVSGLRAGAKGLFALDVTDPTSVTEDGSAARWEFADADIGHVFAMPAIAKTSSGWAVIVGNGYQAAGSPHAQLFVIDAWTGALIRKIDTLAGTSGSPNGLSGAAPVDVDGDGIIDAVYAGDLDGNLWKFDLSGTAASWSVAFNGAPLFAAGAGRPITARPDVARHRKGGLIVIFATGRYLATNDLSNATVQTAYGIWDQGTTAVAASELQQQVMETLTTSVVIAGDTYRFSSHRVGAAQDAVLAVDLPTTTLDDYYVNKRGWYFDLSLPGERVVVDPAIRGGRAIFTSVIPTTNDCTPGGTGWILEVDLFTGNRLASATFDTNNDQHLDTGDFGRRPNAATPVNVSAWGVQSVLSAASFMQFKDGTSSTEIKYVSTSAGTVVQKRESTGTLGQRRVMWRVVQ